MGRKGAAGIQLRMSSEQEWCWGSKKDGLKTGSNGGDRKELKVTDVSIYFYLYISPSLTPISFFKNEF